MRHLHSIGDTTPEAMWRHKARRWSLRERGPTTVCYADGCPNRTVRPRHIAQEKCARYWPETLRPPASLSRLMRGLLAQYRTLGAKGQLAEP